MSQLWSIAQAHLDAYGVSAAALARRMGTSPQTLDSWKNRGLRELPKQALLEALARETRTPYTDVLAAALRDVGYLPTEEREEHARSAPTTQAPSAAVAARLEQLRADYMRRVQAITDQPAWMMSSDSRSRILDEMTRDYTRLVGEAMSSSAGQNGSTNAV